MTMTDMDKGQYKFLLGGLKGGNLLMYNRKKGGKKVLANVTKRKTDIVAMTDIKNIQNSRFFAIQDNKYTIYMYSSDWLYYECGEDGYPVPEMKIKQLNEENAKQLDIYPSQNKLIELRETKFRANKT